MEVFWFICVREAHPVVVPTVASNQQNFNRQTANALTGLSKSRHGIGDLLARPVGKGIRDHLLCDGSAVLRAAFPQLFAEIGTEWGAGDGTTTFNLPNLLVANLPVATEPPPPEETTEPTGGGQTGGTGGNVDVGGRPTDTPVNPAAAYDSSFASINTTDHAVISDELPVVVGGSGTVTLSTYMGISTAKTAPTGIFDVWGKWQWWDGAAWQDVAAEVAADTPVEVTGSSGIYSLDPGALVVNTSKTGLPEATSQKFRLMARNDSGTRTMTFFGTASAIAS